MAACAAGWSSASGCSMTSTPCPALPAVSAVTTTGRTCESPGRTARVARRIASRRSHHQIEVAPLRRNIHGHSEHIAIPLANGISQSIVRSQSERRLLPGRSKIYRRTFRNRERSRKEIARALQMTYAKRPDLQGVDLGSQPFRKFVRTGGNQPAPVHLPQRCWLRSLDTNLVVRVSVESLPVQRDRPVIAHQVPVKDVALGESCRQRRVYDRVCSEIGCRDDVPNGGRERQLVAAVSQRRGQAQPTVHRTSGHQVLERLAVVNSAGNQRKRLGGVCIGRGQASRQQRDRLRQ